MVGSRLKRLRLLMKAGDLVCFPRMDSAMAIVMETNPSVAKVKYICPKKGVQWTPLEYLQVVNESR